MTEHAGDFPTTLSGGEQQRVALARALAPAPALMLLDEAFSALDATLRDTVREETVALLRETRTPTLLVTHDAEEALRVGDCIHVLENGRLVQSGGSAELYRRPVSAFVASFFGAVNRFSGLVRHGRLDLPIGRVPAPELGEGTPAIAIVRPEGVRLDEARVGAGVRATVLERRDLGPVQFLTLVLADGARVTVRRNGECGYERGQQVAIDLDPAHVFVYPASA
jgi:iron(III) transport system ATP-binding protein